MAGVLPDPADCPRCGGRAPVALSDEPRNAITTYHPHPRCPTCGSTPPSAQMLDLPPEVAGLFDGIPWSPCPLHRVLEKLMLWQAVASADRHGAESLVTLIYERAAGRRGAEGGRDGGAE